MTSLLERLHRRARARAARRVVRMLVELDSASASRRPAVSLARQERPARATIGATQS